MIVTARQLEDLHRANGSNGHITLPYRARLSPLAADWIRAKKVAIGYGENDKATNGNASQPIGGHAQPSGCPCPAEKTSSAPHACTCNSGAFLWWCDGPCGPAKAALVGQEKQSSLRAIDVPADAKRLVTVIKSLAGDIKSGKAAGGVLMVQNAALANIYANCCPSLRAVLGTCLESVEQAVQQAAANVLIIEYPHKTLQQMKNMLGRFVTAKRELSDDMKRQLQELATCA